MESAKTTNMNPDGSAVWPARGSYTARVVYYDSTPFPEQYGAILPGGGQSLGSGNPGDQGCRYGVKLNLISEAADYSTGTLPFLDTFYHHLPTVIRSGLVEKVIGGK